MIHLEPYPYVIVYVNSERITTLNDAAYKAAREVIEQEYSDYTITDIRLEHVEADKSNWSPDTFYALAQVKFNLN